MLGAGLTARLAAVPMAGLTSGITTVLSRWTDRQRRQTNRTAGAVVVIEPRFDRLLAIRMNGHRLERILNVECRPADRRAQLERMRRNDWFKGAQTEVLLGIGHRQLNSSPKPPVADAELREAMRWQLRDALDYPPEEAVLDVMPVAETEPPGRQEILVFTARRADLAQLIAPFVEARVNLRRVAAIDCAQRNLAWHGATHRGATALLMPCDGGALCTVSRGEELILSRAIEIANDLSVGTRRFEQAAERMALQMQRSFDLLERRSADAAIAILVVADWGPTAALFLRVAELTSQHVQSMSVTSFVESLPKDANADELTDYLHLIGACLSGIPSEARASALRPLARSAATDPSFTASDAGSGVGSGASDDQDEGLRTLDGEATRDEGLDSSVANRLTVEDDSSVRTALTVDAAAAREDAAELIALEAGLLATQSATTDGQSSPDGDLASLNFEPADRVDLDFHAAPSAIDPTVRREPQPPAVPPERPAKLESVIESDPNLFLVTDPQQALADELRQLAARRDHHSNEPSGDPGLDPIDANPSSRDGATESRAASELPPKPADDRPHKLELLP